MPDKKPSSFISWLVNSKLVGLLANIPPFSWILYWFARDAIRRELHETEEFQYTIVPYFDFNETNTLEQIVRDVVRGLGYAAAFVAPYERGDKLPIRAMYIDSNIISHEQIERLEQSVSELAGRKVSLSDPTIACVSRYDDYYKENLSIKAVNKGVPVVDKSLFSLFTPIAPPSSRQIIQALQSELGIQEVVAIPFFIRAENNTRDTQEIVGNLFAVSQKPITEQDIRILTAFGRQAASAIAHERRRTQVKIAQDLVYNLQRNMQNQQAILEDIVEGVVYDLNYAAAMISLVDERGTLTIRAFHIDETLTDKRNLVDWAKEFADIPEVANSGTNAKFLNINIYDERFAQNLSYQTCQQHQPLQHDSLYALFHTLLPSAAKDRLHQIQQELGIQRIVAVPFYLHGVEKSPFTDELVGILYAASSSRDLSNGEISLLVTFGEQAAASIKNAQNYDVSQKRQRLSISFARMAFNATASLHKFRNDLSPVRQSLSMLSMLENLPEATRKEVLNTIPVAIQRLNIISDLLDSLDKPFIEQAEEMIDVLPAVAHAKDKLNSHIDDKTLTVNIVRENPLPHTLMFREMLVEVFRIILKQCIEAVTRSRIEQGKIEVCLSHIEDKQTIRVMLNHNGVVMSHPEIERLFHLREDERDPRMGFGMYWANDFIQGIGGSIFVSSNHDDGTTFTIDIPVRSNP